METRSVPTVTFCTVAFRTLAQVRCESLGVPDLPVVFLPHPMMTRTREEIDHLVDQLFDEVIRKLTQ
jgi:hypothetical protein